MEGDRGRDIKTRMRADLLTAMKDKRSDDMRTIRALIAAIDNAEAPPMSTARTRSGSSEAERLRLSDADVHNVLSAELRERETAAAEMEKLGATDRANELRTEVLVTRRYLA